MSAYGMWHSWWCWCEALNPNSLDQHTPGKKRCIATRMAKCRHEDVQIWTWSLAVVYVVYVVSVPGPAHVVEWPISPTSTPYALRDR